MPLGVRYGVRCNDITSKFLFGISVTHLKATSVYVWFKCYTHVNCTLFDYFKCPLTIKNTAVWTE